MTYACPLNLQTLLPMLFEISIKFQTKARVTYVLENVLNKKGKLKLVLVVTLQFHLKILMCAITMLRTGNVRNLLTVQGFSRNFPQQ